MEKTMFILLLTTSMVHGERKHPSDGPIPATDAEAERLIEFGTAKDVTDETLAEIAAAEEAAAAEAEAAAAAEAEAAAAAEAAAEAAAAAETASTPPTPNPTGKAKTAKAADPQE